MAGHVRGHAGTGYAAPVVVPRAVYTSYAQGAQPQAASFQARQSRKSDAGQSARTKRRVRSSSSSDSSSSSRERRRRKKKKKKRRREREETRLLAAQAAAEHARAVGRPGVKVQLRGLQASTDFNGLIGVTLRMQEYGAGDCRVVVDLPGIGEKGLKPENLIVAPGEPPAARHAVPADDHEHLETL
eukprot:TRINITY_DN47922_c0_g1_i1.p1 TRINITY_DN47922_c0_g1~~TRINITY_DN47922_c0_g1_i1.p1  ORF type:complete len:205 (+),score=63.70 TRINITY_DN47922_c0_g1_i1:60-617(+)